MTIHDIAPVLFPEYCDHGLARWFASTYLPGIARHVQHAVCVSRNTALDLLAYPTTQNIPRVSALPLPFDLGIKNNGGLDPEILERFGLRRKNYLIFLGSLEPRKNFPALLKGFETFLNLHPGDFKMVMVGQTGWKNDETEKRIRLSPFSNQIVRTGYLSDQELSWLLENAAALGMISHYEGYGLPVAQAFSKGVPVLTTLGSSLPEACLGRGIFVDPEDPFSVAGGIQEILLGKRPMPNTEAVATRTWENYARNLIPIIGESRTSSTQETPIS
jgi:glycosyltransferase involved in cell wall biosynthesis